MTLDGYGAVRKTCTYLLFGRNVVYPTAFIWDNKFRIQTDEKLCEYYYFYFIPPCFLSPTKPHLNHTGDPRLPHKILGFKLVQVSMEIH